MSIVDIECGAGHTVGVIKRPGSTYDDIHIVKDNGKDVNPPTGNPLNQTDLKQIEGILKSCARCKRNPDRTCDLTVLTYYTRVAQP